jgi:hypothetical protein
MVKNPQKENSYVSLSVGVSNFLIETYNVDKPELNFTTNT